MKHRLIHIRYHSVFTRLIVTFLLILLPLFLIGVLIHEWGLQIIRKEIADTIQVQTAHNAEMLESELARVQMLQDDLMVDDDLLYLASIPDAYGEFEKVRAINRLKSRIDTFLTSSLYIADVNVMITRMDRSVSAVNGVAELMPEQKEIMRSFPARTGSRLVNDDGVLYTIVRDANVSSTNALPLFVIQMVLSNDRLLRTSETTEIHAGSASFLLCGALGFHLTQNTDTALDAVVRGLFDGQNSDEMLIDSRHDALEEADGQIEAGEQRAITTRAGKARYMIFAKRLSFREDFWLVSAVPETQILQPLIPYIFLLWGFIAVSLLIVVYFARSTHHFLQTPMRMLVDAFRHVEAGDLDTSIRHDAEDEFGYLYLQFNGMIDNIRHLISQVYAQKIMTQKAELKQLQSQINPHFLYNSFFILQRMIQSGDDDSAKDFCSYLGRYFQYVTRNGSDEAALRQEVAHVRNYLDIQSVRFSGTETEVGALPESMAGLMVPRLILQPIVENVFEHSFKRVSGPHRIEIGFAELEGFARLIVEDNGQAGGDAEIARMNERLRNTPVHEMETTGLVNVHRRIRLMFGEDSGIHVVRGTLGGWRVELAIRMPDPKGASTC